MDQPPVAYACWLMITTAAALYSGGINPMPHIKRLFARTFARRARPGMTMQQAMAKLDEHIRNNHGEARD